MMPRGMTFADDCQALAVELERVVEEATKRATLRAAEDRHLPPVLRGHLERSHRALGSLLAIDAAVGRSAVDRLAALEEQLAHLTGG
jgi:hypothetical protein